MAASRNDPILRKPVPLTLRPPPIVAVTAPTEDTVGRLTRHAVRVERNRTNAEFLVASYVAALWLFGQILGAYGQSGSGSGFTPDNENSSVLPPETPSYTPPTPPFNLEAIYGAAAFAVVAFVLIAVPAVIGVWRNCRDNHRAYLERGTEMVPMSTELDAIDGNIEEPPVDIRQWDHEKRLP